MSLHIPHRHTCPVPGAQHARRSTAQHGPARRSTAQHDAARPSTRGAARPSTPQHGPARPQHGALAVPVPRRRAAPPHHPPPSLRPTAAGAGPTRATAAACAGGGAARRGPRCVPPARLPGPAVCCLAGTALLAPGAALALPRPRLGHRKAGGYDGGPAGQAVTWSRG